MKNCTQRLILFATCASLVAAAWTATPANAWDRGNVETFAVLPNGAAGPEGITVGPDGNVYVSTFGGSAPGKVYVFNDNGKLLRTLIVTGSSSQLLGLDFHPSTQALLVIDFGHATVLNVDPLTGAPSSFITVTGSAGLNALTFDSLGNVYVSDSFQGIIWKTGAGGGPATPWVSNTLLTTSGVPPFGANGLGFNKNGNILFVANTGNDQIIQIPVSGGTPGTPAVFVNSINGADGLILDKNDNIWVAANQADEIVVVDPTGRGIAKLGDFDGLTKDGAPRGLLFPASPVFSKNRQWLYVTNLSLDLRGFNPAFAAVDSQWAAQVTRNTVSRIKARIPPFFDKN